MAKKKNVGGCLKLRSPGGQARASGVTTLGKDHKMNITANAEDDKGQAQTARVIRFRFEAKEVRTLLIDDQPWFVAGDVCVSLGLSDTNKALIGLDGDEKREHEQYSGSGRKPILINESGLYSLILRSRKAEAKRFKKWLTSEVLPAIRKHGHYEDTHGTMGTLIGETIGTNGFNMLGGLLKGKVVCLPAASRRQATAKIWTQTHAAFGVRSAADIPANQLDAARNFIAAYALEGEWLGKNETPGAFQLTDFQATQVTGLLHSVAWVSHRWQQGISKGVAALNPELYGATIEHVQSMCRAARTLDAELKEMLVEVERRKRLGGSRPQQCVVRGIGG